MDERSKILQEIKEKYMLYAQLIKRNRLDVEHNKYCNQENHRLCGVTWGHADIMQEIIGRIWWWFTGYQPYFIKLATKPRLPAIVEAIEKQRAREHWQENEIEDAEYYWLIEIMERCKKLLANCTKEKSKKSVKGNSKK